MAEKIISEEIYNFLKENNLVNEVEALGFHKCEKFIAKFGKVRKLKSGGGYYSWDDCDVWYLEEYGVYIATDKYEKSSYGEYEDYYYHIYSSDTIYIVYPEEITVIQWDKKWNKQI